MPRPIVPEQCFRITRLISPRYQRDYSWGQDEVKDFWSDLSSSLELESYFLGLIILTNPAEGEDPRKHVVDGQQRIITLSLLVTALYYEALEERKKGVSREDTRHFPSLNRLRFGMISCRELSSAITRMMKPSDEF